MVGGVPGRPYWLGTPPQWVGVRWSPFEALLARDPPHRGRCEVESLVDLNRLGTPPSAQVEVEKFEGLAPLLCLCPTLFLRFPCAHQRVCTCHSFLPPFCSFFSADQSIWSANGHLGVVSPFFFHAPERYWTLSQSALLWLCFSYARIVCALKIQRQNKASPHHPQINCL